jgi:GNAT superfamily N-acetyltransferase
LKKFQPVLFRKIRSGDRRALALVYQAAFRDEAWTLRAAEARIGQVLKSGQSAWVACLYGQPIGFAFLSVKEGHQGPYGELTELAVHPFFQKQRVGAKLLRQVKESRKRLKLTTLYGLVYRGPAENFFKKSGFKASQKTVVMAIH